MPDIVICFATALEGEGLPQSVAGRSLSLLQTGVGVVNAAFALTRFLSRHEVRSVVSCGVGGAYPGDPAVAGAFNAAYMPAIHGPKAIDVAVWPPARRAAARLSSQAFALA